MSSIFGYVLWFFFDAVSNYALAVVLFALVINLVMFPFAIKRQKSMAKTAKLTAKQQELKKKYEKNPKKYNEEIARLYEKEGASPMGGCFSMFLPLILLGCVFGAVTKPLENTLHIAPEKVTVATKALKDMPELKDKITKDYEELQLVKHFSDIKHHLTMFNEEELADIEEYSLGYNFLGANLLNRPKSAKFSEMLWLIPVVFFAISIATSFIGQKISGNQMQMQGCNKIAIYAMPLVMSYMAYNMPAAVGFYLIINSIFGILQTVILNKFYSNYHLNAAEEAARFALLKQQEEKIQNI